MENASESIGYVHASICSIISVIDIGAGGEKGVRTTVALPEELLENVDRAVREGRARSRNELLSVALRRGISAMERDRIDEAFGSMAEDPAYRDEAETVAGKFDFASWEALRSVEY